MALALPSQAFSDVQRHLKQRRAGGQTVTPRESRLAWQAYWDVRSARSFRDRELSMRQRESDRNFALQEKAMEREQDAAKVRGVMELGSTAALGAMALKDTSIGAKIGLGTAGGAAPAAIGGAAAFETGGAVAGMTGAELAALSAGEATFGGTAAAAPFSAFAGPAAAGALGGLGGSVLGEGIFGNDAGQIAGGIAGGAGGGALLGSQVGAIGGPIGAIVGGVIGGAIGIVQAIKD